MAPSVVAPIEPLFGSITAAAAQSSFATCDVQVTVRSNGPVEVVPKPPTQEARAWLDSPERVRR